MPFPCQRALFNLDPEVCYLNGAYMSPLLRSVEEAGIRGILRKRQPDKIGVLDFFTDTEKLRALFARLVNSPSADRVAIIPSVSYGMAVVAKNLKARKGQKILLLESQFPSNVYPWVTIAREQGLEIETIAMPRDAATRGRLWNEALLDAIDERTALVAVENVHWANGTLFDLKALGEKAHRYGALLAVDGTQGVGACPMDVQEDGVDALVCAGYKWLMGPYSLGYAYFGAAFSDAQPIEENWVNRLYSEDFARLVHYQEDYQPGARRFDMGERSNFALTPMGIAAIEQLLVWGPEHIAQYCRDLCAEAFPVWEKHGFHAGDLQNTAPHLFGLRTPAHLDAAELQRCLKERRISVSVRGDFIRVSPNVYNDAMDIETLTDVLILLGK
jgi:selenocysteine lyase/cysteine desulfurase